MSKSKKDRDGCPAPTICNEPEWVGIILDLYERVKKEYPSDKRLALKISVCNFNRGVNFIKSRKYLEAKAEFEKIGEDDPIYEKAKRKMRKIEKILKEVESMGQ